MPPVYHATKSIGGAVVDAANAFFDTGATDGLYLEFPRIPEPGDGVNARDRWRYTTRYDPRIAQEIENALSSDLYDVHVSGEREGRQTNQNDWPPSMQPVTVYVWDITATRKGDKGRALIMTLCPPRALGQRHVLVFRDALLV